MNSLDKALPGVFIELGGEKRKLEFSWHAVCQFYRLTGKHVLLDKVDGRDPRTIIKLLWAGLIQNWPELNGEIHEVNSPDEKVKAGLAKLESLLTFEVVSTANEKVLEAIAQAIPQPKKEAAGKGESQA
ncbi:hypothetical protein CCP3SC15_610013 [Gammaproteobacteria bacterium]